MAIPRSNAQPATAAEALRARIIQTAAEHFFAHGFSTITMDDLAGEMGLSKKTLYQHFPGKEELLSAVIRQKAATIRQALDEITQQPNLDYPEKLRRVITILAAKLADIQPVFIHNLKKYAPAHYREVDEIRRENFSRVFTRLLQEGRERGLIRKDLHIPFAIELVLGAFRAMLDGDTLNRLQFTPGEVMERSLDLIFDGLLIRKRGPADQADFKSKPVSAPRRAQKVQPKSV